MTDVTNEVSAEVSELELADSRMQLAKFHAGEARKAFVALLPFATLEHMKTILKATRNGEAIPEGFQPDKYVQLSVVQKAEVKRAALEREADCRTNKMLYVEEAVQNGGDLTAYTIRVGETKTVTRLTFTLSHGTKPAGKSNAAKVQAAYAKVAGQQS